ncbi:MAG: 4a-hydroxytetrahydrobiopterin dehydratase [Polyangiaceae bacterium]|nr:4a-hydroxytetrahydrobiopterin dehydratase [Polyangiaceae bacterium]
MSSREKLSDENIDDFVATHPGWTRKGNALCRSFQFPDYSSALAFVVRVSLAAEKRDHHPDVLLGWGRAEVSWSTHDAGGITAFDTSMAEATDKLYGSQRA